MIEEYGMGSRLFLANAAGNEGITSEAMLRRRDEEQQGLVDEALFEARLLVTENREALDRLAESLLAKETLDRFEIRALVNGGLPDAGKEPAEEVPAAEPVEVVPAADPIEVPAARSRAASDGALEGNGSVGPPEPKPSVPPPAAGAQSPGEA